MEGHEYRSLRGEKRLEIVDFNNHGKLRLVCFYKCFPEEIPQQIVQKTFYLVLRRDGNICNFLIGSSAYELIFGHYATFYFVFCVNS